MRFVVTYILLAALCPFAAAQTSPEMVRVEGGSFVPLYTADERGAATEVVTFYLSVHSVTNGEYLAFVRANPEWRRSRVKRLFAEVDYLSHWAGDLEPGPGAPLDHPVVNVSWFGARAFADWKDMRLPTTLEWEYAAAAGKTRPDGESEDGFLAGVLQMYAARSHSALHRVDEMETNYWGLRGMHGQVWEWVDDFNSSMVTGESRNNSDLDRGLFCGGASLGATAVTDYAAFARYAFRSGLEADFALSNLGFRLAHDAAIHQTSQQ